MFIVITYDVNTETAEGRRRLRQVAKQCVNYGHRVQNSVFECEMDAAKWRQVKAVLEKLIDKSTDSIRFYCVSTKQSYKVEHLGVDNGVDVNAPLIL